MRALVEGICWRCLIDAGLLYKCRGVKEFVGILELHQRYPAKVVEMGVKQALAYGCVHVDGVLQCIYQLVGREEEPGKKGSVQVKEEEQGGQPINLARYEELMKSRW